MVTRRQSKLPPKPAQLSGDPVSASCLLCCNPCAQNRDGASCPEIPGAAKVKPLQKRLTQWFILRKLLQLPLEWCERNLFSGLGGLGECGGVSSGHQEEWFQVCDECLQNTVAQVWRISQQIMALEHTLEELRGEVRLKMKENADKIRDKDRMEGSIVGAIRKMVVPDLLKSAELTEDVQVKIERDADTQDLNDLDLHDADDLHAFDDDPTETWQPNEEDLKVPKEEFVEKKARVKKSKKSVGRKKRKGATGPRGPYKKTLERIAAGLPPRLPKKKYPHRIRKKYPKKRKTELKFDAEGNPIKNVRGKDKRKRKAKPRRDGKPRVPVYPCGDCRALPFATAEELQDHKRLHEERRLNPAMDVDGQSLECGQCSFPAVDSQELMFHVRVRHENRGWKVAPKYECPLLNISCTKTPDKWRDILAHVLKRHSEEVKQQLFQRYVICDQCAFQGQKPIDLKLHKAREHKALQKVPVSSDDVFRCEDCDLLCLSEKELRTHVNSEHRRINRFVCDVCGKGFMTKGNLQFHKISHTKDQKRDWVCEVCGVDFARRDTLQSHHDKYHSEEAMRGRGGMEQYKCRYCNLTSPFNAVIRKHLQTHKQEGEWRCEQCGKFYMNRQGLLRHQRINHNEGGEQVKCPHCNKGYPSKEYMQIHVRLRCKLKDLHGGNGPVGGYEQPQDVKHNVVNCKPELEEPEPDFVFEGEIPPENY